jgi:hypothetical protein
MALDDRPVAGRGLEFFQRAMVEVGEVDVVTDLREVFQLVQKQCSHRLPRGPFGSDLGDQRREASFGVGMVAANCRGSAATTWVSGSTPT